MMDRTIPWSAWIKLIEPHYYDGKKGRKPKPPETMLRMYLLQVWFSLSDEGVEDAIYDSYAMRTFMGLDFGVEQVPDATTLLHFRHLLEKHELGKKLFESQNEIFDEQVWIMRGGTIVDATIIAAPSSTKNATGTRDPEMRQMGCCGDHSLRLRRARFGRIAVIAARRSHPRASMIVARRSKSCHSPIARINCSPSVSMVAVWV